MINQNANYALEIFVYDLYHSKGQQKGLYLTYFGVSVKFSSSYVGFYYDIGVFISHYKFEI